MTRLQQLPVSLQRSLEQRSALKVIAGLMNFDAASVERVARAAGRGGADLIDVACDPALVRLAIEASGGVPVCVSSVEPEQFPAAVAAGPAPASPQTSNDQIAAGLLLGFGRACSQNSGDSSELVGFVEDVTSRAAGPPPPPPES